MKFKKDKGYVGIDITVSILLIVVIIPTIAGMIFNINKSNNSIKRKTQASSIAAAVMENAKILTYDGDDNNFLTNVYNGIRSQYNGKIVGTPSAISNENWEENGESFTAPTGTINIEISDVLYQLKTSLRDENEKKVLRAKVEYKVGNDNESITLKTVFILK